MFCLNKFNAAIALQGENQGDAAKVMGISMATLYRKITGKSDFYRKEIDAFCAYYKANPEEIFFAKDSA